MTTNTKSSRFTCVVVPEQKVRSNIYGKRISMAYAHLQEIPKEIIRTIAVEIQFLDLTCNNFTDLSFLQHFPQLQTLVLDRNYNLDCTSLPHMLNLKILWLNNCNLININDWLEKLQLNCPNLRHLSMMCNPVGHTVLNGVTDAEERKYRQHVVKILPQLTHFDGISVIGLLRQSSSHYMPLGNTAGRAWKFTKKLHKKFKSMEALSGSFMSFNAKKASIF